ncbi:MAG: DnaD domain protein [Oscillospiraceae bacterium]|nr:DnaD domain protein [Oscillospiraceae bacterium]
MNIESVYMEKSQVQKLLSAASGDAALLYLYLKSGNPLEGASAALQLNDTRLSCAAATLRQLGIWQQEQNKPVFGERPAYTEQDVLRAMGSDDAFHSMYGEVQRRLGRVLTTEELKILLGFVRYLGLGEDVVCVLVTYCIERNRQRGNPRNPSLRTIEKEAYAWAEQGIDTMAAAAAFIHGQNVYFSRMGQLQRILQIRGRNLTAAEEKYAKAWLEMGFEDEALTMAYERTCLNTGGLNWAYMNKILTRWKDAGWTRAGDIRNGDRKPVPKGASGGLGAAELEAIQKVLQEG